MSNGIVIGLLILAVLLVLSFIVSMLIHVFITPIVFTPKSVIDEIVKFFKVSEKDKIIELGAGDGRVGYALAKKSPKKVAFFEISPLLNIVIRVKSWVYKLKRGKSKIEINAENLFKTDFKEFTSAYVYLEPKLMQRLLSTVIDDLNKGLVIYAYRYPFPQIKEKETLKLSNGENLYIYYVN